MWPLSEIEKEWPVIIQAPMIVTMIFITSLAITWLLHRYLFQTRMQIVEVERDDLRRQLISATRGDSEIKISISQPRDGGKIGMKHVVKGTIDPPGRPVQVLILSGDKMWYPQKAVTSEGRNWRVDCWFGNEKTPEGSPFTIAAIDGSYPFDLPIEKLPERVPASSLTSVRKGA